ncbi:Monocarboxylate transporter 9 [Armadillidium vulgare]|nr:Monocarboxylate transporter 9 [Armadillidium vulgare]
MPPAVPSGDALPKLSSENGNPVKDKNKIKRNAELVPPDGGWGWMIVVGSLVTTVLGYLPGYAFSIIFQPIFMSNGVSSAKIAWIFNFFTLTWNTFIIFVGPLCEQFGSRKLAVTAGVAGSLSLVLSAFAPTPDYLFLTYALLGGAGGSTIFALSYMVVSSYFTKNIGLALGITSIGGSISI